MWRKQKILVVSFAIFKGSQVMFENFFSTQFCYFFIIVLLMTIIYLFLWIILFSYQVQFYNIPDSGRGFDRYRVYKNYDEQNLIRAVEAVVTGRMTQTNAAKFFGVPRKTIHYRMQKFRERSQLWWNIFILAMILWTTTVEEYQIQHL